MILDRAAVHPGDVGPLEHIEILDLEQHARREAGIFLVEHGLERIASRRREEIDQHRNRLAADIEPSELEPAGGEGSGDDLAEKGLGMGIAGERGARLALPPGLFEREIGVAPGTKLRLVGKDMKGDPAKLGEAVLLAPELLALLRAHRLLVISLGGQVAVEEGAHPAMDDRRGTNLGQRAVQRPVLGDAAHVQEIGRPIDRVQRLQDRFPEGPFLPRLDLRGIEEHLVVPPILDVAQRQPRIAALDRQHHHPDQPRAAADLDEAQIVKAAEMGEARGGEPLFGERVRLGGARGERSPLARKVDGGADRPEHDARRRLGRRWTRARPRCRGGDLTRLEHGQAHRLHW